MRAGLALNPDPDYLKVVRRDGWLAQARLEGPLWIASQPPGEQKRMSQRTAMQAWRTFLDGVSGLSEEYQQSLSCPGLSHSALGSNRTAINFSEWHLGFARAVSP